MFRCNPNDHLSSTNERLIDLLTAENLEDQIKTELSTVFERFKVEQNIDWENNTTSADLIPFSHAQSFDCLTYLIDERKKHDKSSKTGSQISDFTNTYSSNFKIDSSQSFADLDLVDLTELRTNKIHRGKYILCRTSTRAFSQVSTQFGVTSPFGASIVLNLYHYPLLPVVLGTPTYEDWDAQFPVGTILAIKEPWVKTSLLHDSSFPFIRVDSPTDIQIILPDDPLLSGIIWRTSLIQLDAWKPKKSPMRSMEEWKTIGNSYWRKGRYLLAFIHYSDGIAQHKTALDRYILLLNRAAAAIKLERFSLSLQDAVDCIHLLNERSDTNPVQLEKAHHRKAMSLYSLRQWKSAKNAFMDMKDRFPSSLDAIQGLERVASRLREAETGFFDIKTLRHLDADPMKRLDLADYVSSVEVFETKNVGGGRGVRATKDIKAGELVMVVKALASVFPSDNVKRIRATNLHTKRVERPFGYALITETVYRFLHQDSLVQPLVNSLYDGTKSSKAIMFQHSPSISITPEKTVNVSRIERVLSYNSFSSSEIVDSLTKDVTDERPAMLFAHSSLINHSCIPNSSWNTIGDVQFIHACKDIQKGAEVSISYCGDILDFETRRTFLRSHFLDDTFNCACPWCAEERSQGDTILATRQNLLSSFQNQSTTNSLLNSLRYTELLLDKLNKTYNNVVSFRPALCEVYCRISYINGLLAVAEKDPTRNSKSMEASMNALKVVGVEFSDSSVKKSPIQRLPLIMHEHATRCALQIASLYGPHRKNTSQKWIEAAFSIEKCFTGADKSSFEEKHKNQLDCVYVS